MITIINYGVGNLNAFINLYKRVGVEVKIANTISDLVNVDKIILPGVGHFDHAMSELNKSGMRERLDELVLKEKVPVMGICVGMQIMANYSEEGIEKGLGWIDASVHKFDESKISYKTKTPHMGWNDVLALNIDPIFNELDNESIFYFLHSYYFKCNNGENILAQTDYCGEFTSVAKHENIYAVQFHPEKSHSFGEIFLHNFAKL